MWRKMAYYDKPSLFCRNITYKCIILTSAVVECLTWGRRIASFSAVEALCYLIEQDTF